MVELATNAGITVAYRRHRHTAAMRALEDGVPVHDVALRTGHVRVRTLVDHYVTRRGRLRRYDRRSRRITPVTRRGEPAHVEYAVPRLWIRTDRASPGDVASELGPIRR